MPYPNDPNQEQATPGKTTFVPPLSQTLDDGVGIDTDPRASMGGGSGGGAVPQLSQPQQPQAPQSAAPKFQPGQGTLYTAQSPQGRAATAPSGGLGSGVGASLQRAQQNMVSDPMKDSAGNTLQPISQLDVMNRLRALRGKGVRNPNFNQVLDQMESERVSEAEGTLATASAQQELDRTNVLAQGAQDIQRHPN